MQTKKMSLANIQGKLSRAEMKNIMAGSGSGHGGICNFGTGAWIGSCNAADIQKYCRAGGYCY